MTSKNQVSLKLPVKVVDETAFKLEELKSVFNLNTDAVIELAVRRLYEVTLYGETSALVSGLLERSSAGRTYAVEINQDGKLGKRVFLEPM